MFSSWDFVNYAKHPQSPFLETLLACDSWHFWFSLYFSHNFIYVFCLEQLLVCSSSSTSEFEYWHMPFLYYTISLDNLIYHHHSFNYHQSTDISQTCHSSTDNDLQISYLSSGHFHFRWSIGSKTEFDIYAKSSTWPQYGIYICLVSLVKFWKIIPDSSFSQPYTVSKSYQFYRLIC